MVALIICSYPKIAAGIRIHTGDLHIRHLKRKTILGLMFKSIFLAVIYEQSMLFGIYIYGLGRREVCIRNDGFRKDRMDLKHRWNINER